MKFQVTLHAMFSGLQDRGVEGWLELVAGGTIFIVANIWDCRLSSTFTLCTPMLIFCFWNTWRAWLGFHQVERQFHGRELNCKPLRAVWVPLHYHPVVWGHLGPNFNAHRDIWKQVLAPKVSLAHLERRSLQMEVADCTFKTTLNMILCVTNSHCLVQH